MSDEQGQTFSAPGKVIISLKEGDEWIEAPNATATFKVDLDEDENSACEEEIARERQVSGTQTLRSFPQRHAESLERFAPQKSFGRCAFQHYACMGAQPMIDRCEPRPVNGSFARETVLILECHRCRGYEWLWRGA